MNKEILAEWMHDQYEEISRKVNWETQAKCRVKFKDLPNENREVMIKLAEKLIQNKDLKLVVFVCPMCNYEYENQEGAISCCVGQ